MQREGISAINLLKNIEHSYDQEERYVEEEEVNRQHNVIVYTIIIA
jgi:hypothetical protein